MESKLVCAAEYLSYREGVLLFNKLEEAGISALVKTCGPPSIPFGDGQFYQLLVVEEDLSEAKEISDSFKVALAEAKNLIKCPTCKSEAVFKVETLAFWERIYFAGTQVCKCENCSKKFSI